MTTSEREELRAELHLRAVVPSLAQLAAWDKSLLASMSENTISYALSYPHAKPSIIRWSAEGLSTEEKAGSFFSMDRGAASVTTTLRFWSARHLNETFDGKTKFPPLPLGGLLGLGRLKEFESLTEALRRALEPTAAQMKDPVYFERHALLNFTIAMRSLPVLLSRDPEGRTAATKLPNGTYEFAVRTPHHGLVRWGIRRGSQQCDFFTPDGKETPLVRVTFTTPEVLYRSLCQELDQVAAVGLGEIEIEGLAPLADLLGLVLERVETYLPLRRPTP